MVANRIESRYLNLKKLRKTRKSSRLAVSEVIGAIIMLGATIIIGLVAWIYVGQAARGTESGLNNQATENFKVVNANFGNTHAKNVTLDIFNVQTGAAYITAIVVTNGTWESNNPSLTWPNGTWTVSMTTATGPNCKNCLALKPQTITIININVGTYLMPPLPNNNNCTYTFKVIGEYGLDAQYQQVR
jgi:hypothetical protein